MADETNNDVLKILQGTIDTQNKKIAKLFKEAMHRKELLAERDKELEALRTQTKAPDDLLKQIDTLKSQLKQRDLKEAVSKAAKANKLREDLSADDLLALSGLSLDGDLDEEAITAKVAEVAKAKPFLVASDEGAKEAAKESPKQLTPGPGVDRGQAGTYRKVTVSKRDLADPEKSYQTWNTVKTAKKNGVEIEYAE